MNRFERFLIMFLSITLLVVAGANAYINFRQNEMIDRLYDYVYVLEANLDTKCDRLTLELSSYKQSQTKVHDIMLETIGDMIIRATGGAENGSV